MRDSSSLRCVRTTVRLALALSVALAACGGSSSPPPPHTLPPLALAKLEAMSWEDRCDAVAPRAKPCMDELLVAHAADLERDLGDAQGFAELMKEHVEEMGKSSAKELQALHRAECSGDDDYPFATVTCWSRTDCKQFATCVVDELAKTPRPERSR